MDRLLRDFIIKWIRLLDQLQTLGEVHTWTEAERNKEYIGFLFSNERWQIIYALAIGPRLGIKEYLLIYDSNQLEEYRIVCHPANIIEDCELWANIIELRAKRLQSRLKREGVRLMCQKTVEEIIEKVKKNPDEMVKEALRKMATVNVRTLQG